MMNSMYFTILLLLQVCLLPLVVCSSDNEFRVSDSKGDALVVPKTVANRAMMTKLFADCKNKCAYHQTTDVVEVWNLIDFLATNPDVPREAYEIMEELSESAIKLKEVIESADELEEARNDLSRFQDLGLKSGEMTEKIDQADKLGGILYTLRQDQAAGLIEDLHSLQELSKHWYDPIHVAMKFIENGDFDIDEVESVKDDPKRLRVMLTGQVLSSFAFSAIVLGHLSYEKNENSSGMFVLYNNVETLDQQSMVAKLQQHGQLAHDDATDIALLLASIAVRHPEIIASGREKYGGKKELTVEQSNHILELMVKALNQKRLLDVAFEDPSNNYNKLRESGLLREKYSKHHPEMVKFLEYNVAYEEIVLAAAAGGFL